MNKKTSFLYDVKKITLLGSLAFLGACNHMEPLEGQASSKRSTSRLVNMDPATASAANSAIQNANQEIEALKAEQSRLEDEIAEIKGKTPNLVKYLEDIRILADEGKAGVTEKKEKVEKLNKKIKNLQDKIDELRKLMDENDIIEKDKDGKVIIRKPDGKTELKDPNDLTPEDWNQIIKNRTEELTKLTQEAYKFFDDAKKRLSKTNLNKAQAKIDALLEKIKAAGITADAK